MVNISEEIRLEILRASHLEHENALRTLAAIYHVDDPKRVKVMNEANHIIGEIHKIKKPDL